MTFLLAGVALNVGKVFLVFILVFPDSSGVDASGRSILALALSSRSSSTRTIVLFLLGLCRRGLSLA